MLIKAEQKFIRMSPQKLRLVARGMREIKDPQKALNYLRFVQKKAAGSLAKVIKQAVANAQNNMKLSPTILQIREIQVGEGPRLKRYRAGSRGMAKPILKRMSHIRVVLEDKPQEKKEEERGTKS